LPSNSYGWSLMFAARAALIANSSMPAGDLHVARTL
jgi:hypothetical protein